MGNNLSHFTIPSIVKVKTQKINTGILNLFVPSTQSRQLAQKLSILERLLSVKRTRRELLLNH
jgi:Trp operon repressor